MILPCNVVFLNSNTKGDILLYFRQEDSTASKPSEMKTMRAHSGPVYGLAFVPESSLLLSCSEDTTGMKQIFQIYCSGKL